MVTHGDHWAPSPLLISFLEKLIHSYYKRDTVKIVLECDKWHNPANCFVWGCGC